MKRKSPYEVLNGYTTQELVDILVKNLNEVGITWKQILNDEDSIEEFIPLCIDDC